MKKINNRWETPVCDNCGKEKYSVYLDRLNTWEYPGNFRIVRCVSCGLLYLSPRPKKAYIGRYYQKESYWGKNLTSDFTQDAGWEKIRDAKYGRIYGFIQRKFDQGAILDVGAGTGEFLSKFQKPGWKTLGIELAKEAVMFAQKVNHLTLIPGDFAGVKLTPKTFDVVTFNSSLEHLYSPKTALKKAYQLLKDGGIAVITVPNSESLGAAIFGKNWLPYHPPKHLYHFSFSSLKRMASAAGFIILERDDWSSAHAYYSLFQSARYLFSPRFTKTENGGLKPKQGNIMTPRSAGKLAASLFALAVATIGSLVGRGEVITVYAKKT